MSQPPDDPPPDAPRWVESSMSADLTRHDGGLPPAVGVHNHQILRAHRPAATPDQPERGHTYNHAPMLCRWRETWFLQFLSGPVSEHEAPCPTRLMRSDDLIHWSASVVAFPSFPVPDRFGGGLTLAHQRMGFFISPTTGRLLTLGHHGLPPDPFDGRGVARLVREVLDPTPLQLGRIFVLRYNPGLSQADVPYPFFMSSPDSAFIAACQELLADPLQTQQWWEEDRFSTDDLFAVTQTDDPDGFGCQAFCWYPLADGRIVGLWKHAWATVAEKWRRGSIPTPAKMDGIVYHGAKAWGQPTGDGRYAMVYNPTGAEWRYRFPLSVVVSDDGLLFRGPMLNVHDEVPPPRYGGKYKDAGPQYVRGDESRIVHPGDDLVLAYSVNKEDLWVARVPVPIADGWPDETDGFSDDFAADPDASWRRWNIYSPLWAPVSVERDGAGTFLRLSDADPHDHAKASRVFRPMARLAVSLEIRLAERGAAPLEIDLLGADGIRPIRLRIDPADGGVRDTVGGAVLGPLNDWTRLVIECDVPAGIFRARSGDGTWTPLTPAEPTDHVVRLELRTGRWRGAEVSGLPYYDHPQTTDLSDDPTPRSRYDVRRVTIGPWT